MADAFDPRIVKVGIDFGDGQITTFEGLNINITGQQFFSTISNTCEVRIYNLTREQREFILTNASPFKQPRTPVNITVDVGRQSYGTFRIYEGNVIECQSSQPPDIGILMHSLTGNFLRGDINNFQQSAITPLNVIVAQVGQILGANVINEATDKQVDNFSFTGSATALIKEIEDLGVDVTLTNGTLIVKNRGVALGGEVRPISAATGMVGVPEIMPNGVRVKLMIDNSITIGKQVMIDSKINPAANGTYWISTLTFEIANREEPFWYVAECLNSAGAPALAAGT